MKYFLIIISVLLLLSCDSSTSSFEKGSLSGSIYLENMDDHSDITVELYNLAELNPEIVEINNDYPNIGVIINQQTDFDHRVESPISSTSTDSNGGFRVSNIPVGMYNLVARKDGWGWRYVYEVKITEGNNTINFGEENIYLYPEQLLSGAVNENVVIEPYHHLIIEEDVIFLPESLFQLEQNSVVRINPGKIVTIYGQTKLIAAENNQILITSNSLTGGNYQYFSIENTASIINNTISWCKFEYSSTSLINKTNDLEFSNNILRYGNSGFTSSVAENININNNLAMNFDNSSQAGIFLNFIESGVVENNVTINCYSGITLKDECDQLFTNNYSLNCSYGFEFYTSNSMITYNTTINCENGVRICGDSSPQFEYNEINGNIGVRIGFSGYYPNANPVMHHNNINGDEYFFYLYRMSMHDITADNNYFYTTNLSEISNKMYDKDDYLITVQAYIGIVLFEPILTREVSNAGVLNN